MTVNEALDVISAYCNGKITEVVQCKDCKKQFTSDCLLMFFGMRKSDDWYCADGVKKE